jgi:hypothetical protein
MKVVALFILSFFLVSALPFIWNQFTFVQVGFPFTYMQRSVIEMPEYSQSVYSFVKLNLVYDLIVMAIAVWGFTRLRTPVRNRS